MEAPDPESLDDVHVQHVDPTGHPGRDLADVPGRDARRIVVSPDVYRSISELPAGRAEQIEHAISAGDARLVARLFRREQTQRAQTPDARAAGKTQAEAKRDRRRARNLRADAP